MNSLFPIYSPSAETAFVSYRDDAEYLREQLQWLDVVIAFQLRIQEPDISAESSETAAKQFGEMLEAFAAHIGSRLAASEREGVRLALPHVSAQFGLSELERQAVLVCLAVELERKYETAYELLQPGGGGKYPTPDLIAALVSRSEAERLQALHALRSDGLLRKMFMRGDIALKVGAASGQPVLLDERMALYLTGLTGLPEAMGYCAKLVPPVREPAPLIGNTDMQTKLRSWIVNRVNRMSETESPEAQADPIVISLWGKRGAGKKTQLVHLAAHFNESLLIVDVDKLTRTASDWRLALRRIFRETTLQQAVLVLSQYHPGNGEEDDSRRVADLLDELGAMSGLVFLLSEEPCQPLDHRHRIALEMELVPLEDGERAEAWRQFAGAYAIQPAVEWEALAARFLFTPGQIANALSTAKTLSEWDAAGTDEAVIGWRHLIQASYKQLNHKLGSKATRLSPKNSWDDLILPDAQKEKLQHACNHIQYKHTVYGKWGFGQKLSYGTGISLLFSGPPGTGKTMASEIVAKQLDMEIYKIDLSQIISKYIGETEKNLRDIFNEAQASHAVLFFDEADALFGKRSEVKDSHDKNANTEVAFLLQKMEEYRGISILATNYLQNMDEAFLRRINYVIRFPFPDEKQRETIWRHIFPTQTPLDADIDFGFLARKFQMAGGNIKNIALTAAFLASGSGERVGMKHIFKAYQYELDKTNRALTKDDLGEYAYAFD